MVTIVFTVLNCCTTTTTISMIKVALLLPVVLFSLNGTVYGWTTVLPLTHSPSLIVQYNNNKKRIRQYHFKCSDDPVQTQLFLLFTVQRNYHAKNIANNNNNKKMMNGINTMVLFNSNQQSSSSSSEMGSINVDTTTSSSIDQQIDFDGYRSTTDDTVTPLNEIPFDSLLEMDLVIYEERLDSSNTNTNLNTASTTGSTSHSSVRKLGAVQEDGTVAPISVWSSEPVYGTSYEFVVDEIDRYPGLTNQLIRIVRVLDQNVIGYGSRQVHGGKGPGNPHGEESELLYYIDQIALTSDVTMTVKPELEILW